MNNRKTENNVYSGEGIRPIVTTCSCGKRVTMKHNGNWHSADCSCGRNIRQKGGTLIIEKQIELKRENHVPLNIKSKGVIK